MLLKNKISERLKKLLSDKSGSIYFTSCILMLCILIFAAALWNYTAIVTDVRTSADSATFALRGMEAAISFNAREITNIQRGRIGSVSLETRQEKFIEYFVESANLKLNDDGNMYYCYNENGEEVYHTTIPVIKMAVAEDGASIIFQAEYTIYLPMEFAGKFYSYVSSDVIRQIKTGLVRLN